MEAITRLIVLFLAVGARGGSATNAGDLLHETFENGMDSWVSSKAEAYEGVVELKDGGLVLPAEAKRYGVGSPLSTPWSPGNDLVVQYELTFTDGALECGGAYLKLLSGSPDLALMNESFPFSVMFGPDKCGATNKVHLIVQHMNPTNGQMIEHHMKQNVSPKTGKLAHLYTLIVRQDNSFSVLVDQVEEAKGMLTSADDFDPPFTPPKTIADPDEKKPEDWVDQAKIDDPEAKKPEDWDEDAPAQIPDPDAKKPEGWLDDAPFKVPDPTATMPDDWSEEEDGPWEAPPIDNPDCKPAGCGEWKQPMIPNPAFKGKWVAPQIDNPAYKGVWAPQQIDNPAFFDCTDPASGIPPIGAVAIEVWLYKPKGPKFSNILIGTNAQTISDFADKTWKVANDAAVAKEKEEAAKAAEEAKQRRIEEGGFAGTVEMVLDKAAENPVVALPVVLLFFLFVFKMCFGRKAQEEEPEAAAAESNNEAAAAESNDEKKPEDSKDTENENGQEKKEKMTLRQRSAKGKVATTKEMIDDY